MNLFHGSYLTVEAPDVSFSRDNVDFGKGFYTTPIWEQAISWASRFKRKRGQSVVSVYEIDIEELYKNMKVLTFGTYSEDWLDFIIECRRGKNPGGYDVVAGGVANDKVFDTIQLYFDELIDKAAAINRLRYDNPNMQYCFRNQAVIDKYLKFLSGEVV